MNGDRRQVIPLNYPDRGIYGPDILRYYLLMKPMKIQNNGEMLNFFAAAVFFCIGMIVMNPRYIAISSSWDYIVLRMLTFLNGLGLCLMLGLMVNSLCINRALRRDELDDEASEEVDL